MIAPPPIYQIPFLIIRAVIPLLILFSLSPLLRAQPQTFFYRSWTQSGSTLDPNFINHVVSTVNSSRETYVASSTLNTSSTYSMRLTKYGSSGAESWHADFTVNTGGNVHMGAIALDPSENILITGSAYNGSTNNYDLFTAKYNPSGAKLWHALHNGAGNSFDGGTAKDYTLELGSNTFIPGFEDQLIGASAGDKKLVNVTFPAEYGNKDLADKAAVFEVEVKSLKSAKPVAIDDEFAKKMGLEGLTALKDAVKKQIEQEYNGVSRSRLKRKLLDVLADSHSFEVPQGMVSMEFDQIWQQLQGDSPEAVAEREKSGKTEDELKTEYRGIAERRGRLGLLLAHVGQDAKIEVKQEELTRAVMEQARRFPGQEKQVLEFFRSNEQATNSLRAPIFEDKVVDYILELAKVNEKKVATAELMADPDEEAKPAA